MATLPNVNPLDLISDTWANSIIAAINALDANNVIVDGYGKGHLGSVTVTSNTMNVQAEQDLTGFAVSVTPPAGRRIMCMLRLGLYSQASGVWETKIFLNGAQVAAINRTYGIGFDWAHLVWVGNSTGAAMAFKARGSHTVAPGFNTSVGGTYPGYLVVTDLGKV